MTLTSYQESVDKLTAEPRFGQASPKVTAQLVNGRARLSAGPFNFDADLPPLVGGGNQAPSPTAYLLGALAACAVAYVNDTLAPEFGVVLDDLTAEAGCTTDLAGLFGLDGTDPRLHQLSLRVSLASPSNPAAVQALQDAWLARCPVYLALREPTAVEVQFTALTQE